MTAADNLPHWKTHGGRGPHLLLVHGFLSSSAQWQPNLTALAGCCRPVTVELFGHARSPSPADPAAFEPAYYVDCFEHIRQKLGVERWCLLGYSLGAGLTLRYAFEHPERVICHGFTNSTSALADATQRTRWRESAPETAARIREHGQSAVERIPVHPKHARSLPPPLKDALLEDARHHDPEGIAKTLLFTNPEVSVRERLTDNARPALLICGKRERRFQAHRDFALDVMPELEVADLDAGHGMNMERPAEFNDALGAFLTRHCTPCATS
jgi:pimeloyl-ACP methyl ester carboxylesterase